MRIGPTGDFPHGKLNDHDEGGLRVAISSEPDKDIVRIDFGKHIEWLAMPRHMAREFAYAILKHAGVKVEIVEHNHHD